MTGMSATIRAWCGLLLEGVVVFATAAQGTEEDQPVAVPSMDDYGQLHSLSLRARAKPEVGQEVILDLTIDEHGRFSYKTFSTYAPGPGREWKDQPGYFVFFDGHNVVSGRAPGSSYLETSAGPNWLRVLGAPQHLFAPWPLLASTARGPASTDSGASSTIWKDANSELGLTWNDPPGQVAVTWTATGGGEKVIRQVRFDDFRSTDGFSLPWRMRERTTRIHESDEKSTELIYIVEEAKPNPPDLEQSLQFDAVAMSVNRYDSSTGNIYSPTGELLYNEDDWNRRLAEQPGGLATLRKWGVPLLVLIAIISAWWGYRRTVARKLA